MLDTKLPKTATIMYENSGQQGNLNGCTDQFSTQAEQIPAF